eukprot:g74185.t1
MPSKYFLCISSLERVFEQNGHDLGKINTLQTELFPSSTPPPRKFSNQIPPTMALLGKDCDIVLKIIMIGDSGVGKSCLLKSFMGDPFHSDYTSTIGVDFEIKPVQLDGKTANLQIWDTAGQERFRTITTSYYRSSDAILVVFDVTDNNSFQNLNAWLEDVHLYAKKNIDIILIGNKVDLTDERKVDFKTASEYAASRNMGYLETSAKENINVDRAFTQLALQCIKNKGLVEAGKQKPEEEQVKLTAHTTSSSGGCSYVKIKHANTFKMCSPSMIAHKQSHTLRLMRNLEVEVVSALRTFVGSEKKQKDAGELKRLDAREDCRKTGTVLARETQVESLGARYIGATLSNNLRRLLEYFGTRSSFVFTSPY